MSYYAPDLRKLLSVVPSWPFRTEAARSIWSIAEKLLDKNPEAQLQAVLQDATWKAKVPAYELTSDDYSLLVMAMRWKAGQRKAEKVQPY